MEKIIFDEQFNFAIKFWKNSPEDTHWLNFKAVECVANGERTESGEWKLAFNNYDLGRRVDDCVDFEEAYKENPLCDGFIKWDGCMEIHSLNYHFCGYDDILQRLTRKIYEGAKEILGDNLDDDLANLNGELWKKL